MNDEDVSAQFEWFHQLAELPPDQLAQQATPANQAAFAAFVEASLPGHVAPLADSGEAFAKLVLDLRQNDIRWNKALMAALIEADDLFKAREPSKAVSLLESFASNCPWLLYREVALDQSEVYAPDNNPDGSPA